MPMMARGAGQGLGQTEPDAPYYVLYWCHRSNRWTEAQDGEHDQIAPAISQARSIHARSGRPVQVLDASGRQRFHQ